jgi:cytoskeletal protein CcmA (bactofilin family)
MAKFAFDREKQQEEKRIDELRGFLGKVETPEFWDSLTESKLSSADQPDSFQRAIIRRADALGVTPQKLLSDYAQELRKSTYPTPDCLEAEEAQEIFVSRKPNAAQSAHLEVCEACRVDDTELKQRVFNIRQAGAEAERAEFREEATSQVSSRESHAVPVPIGVAKTGLRIRGEITAGEDLQIDGSVEGLIRSELWKVTVLGSAVVGADIFAREVVIYGKVTGNVRAKELVELKKDGSLHGEITSARVMIEDGAYFKGSIELDATSTGRVRNDSSSRPGELTAARGLKAAQSH